MTITCFAKSTSRIGIPNIGDVSSVLARGLTTSLAPSTTTTSVEENSEFISSNVNISS